MMASSDSWFMKDKARVSPCLRYFVNKYRYLHVFDLYGEVWKPDKRLRSGTTFKPLSLHVLIFRGKAVIFRYVTKRIVLSFLSLYDCETMTLRAAVNVNLAKPPGPTTTTPLIFELHIFGIRFM